MVIIAVIPAKALGAGGVRGMYIDNSQINSVVGAIAIKFCRYPKEPTYNQAWPSVLMLVTSDPKAESYFPSHLDGRDGV